MDEISKISKIKPIMTNLLLQIDDDNIFDMCSVNKEWYTFCNTQGFWFSYFRKQGKSEEYIERFFITKPEYFKYLEWFRIIKAEQFFEDVDLQETLKRAIEYDYSELVEYIIQDYTDIDEIYELFYIAVSKDSVNTVEYIILNFPDVFKIEDGTDCGYSEALYYIIRGGDESFVNIFDYVYKTYPELLNKYILREITGECSLEMLKYLIENNIIEPNEQNYNIAMNYERDDNAEYISKFL